MSTSSDKQEHPQNQNIDNAATTSSATTSTTATAEQQQQDDDEPASSATGNSAICAVCGEENAKMHYGVLACLGCKGFFRRALKKVNEYECLRTNNCTIDKQERNSCRSCRLQKCLDVGMDPAAVRPDRDFTGKQHLSRKFTPSSRRKQNIAEQKRTNATGSEDGKTWSQRLPVEMRTMLMTLQNIEAKVVHGDTTKDANEVYPLRINTIREIIEEPTKLRGRRTEMRYEPWRMAKNEEFSMIVYRRLIAAIDWVELLAERLGGLSTEDRIALVKACFGPLTLFKCSARTAVVTNNEDMLCLCNFAYVPREISKAYNDAYHLDNGLVERLLNELVSPFRRIHLMEEEVVCISAIIVLNPMARDLSEEAAEKIFQLRNRIYATLYQIIKECRPNCNTNATFGNMLLYLPIIASLANAMSENLRFAQTFSTLGGIPLLTSLFGCFPVEPFLDSEMALLGTNMKESNDNRKQKSSANAKKSKRRRHSSDASTQTDWKSKLSQLTRKRRLGAMDSIDESNKFCLFKAPCSYTLTEMFDDRINEEDEQQQQQEGSEGSNRLCRTKSFQQMLTSPNEQGQNVGTGFRPHSSSLTMGTGHRHPVLLTTKQSGTTQQPSFVQTQPTAQQHAPMWAQQQAQTSSHQQQQTTIVQLFPPTQQIQQLYLNDERQQTAQLPRQQLFQQSQCHWPNYPIPPQQMAIPFPTPAQFPPPFPPSIVQQQPPYPNLAQIPRGLSNVPATTTHNQHDQQQTHDHLNSNYYK